MKSYRIEHPKLDDAEKWFNYITEISALINNLESNGSQAVTIGRAIESLIDMADIGYREKLRNKFKSIIDKGRENDDTLNINIDEKTKVLKH